MFGCGEPSDVTLYVTLYVAPVGAPVDVTALDPETPLGQEWWTRVAGPARGARSTCPEVDGSGYSRGGDGFVTAPEAAIPPGRHWALLTAPELRHRRVSGAAGDQPRDQPPGARLPNDDAR